VLARDDPPPVSVFCTITQWNAGTLWDFLEEMRRLGLERVGLMHNNFVTELQAERHNLSCSQALRATPSNIFQSHPEEIDLPRLAEDLRRIAATDYPFPVSIQPNLIEERDLETYYRAPEVFFGRRCNDATRIVMIDSDGEAIPVHGRCYRFPIANIRQTALKDIWNHPSLAALRRSLHAAGGLLPACSRCCGGFG